jgi:hypothetical protein
MPTFQELIKESAFLGASDREQQERLATVEGWNELPQPEKQKVLETVNKFKGTIKETTVKDDLRGTGKAVGSAVGSVAPLLIPGPGGIAMKAARPVIGSILGTIAGEKAETLARGESQPFTLEGIKKEFQSLPGLAKEGAMAEMGGQIGGTFLQTLATPFKKSFMEALASDPIAMGGQKLVRKGLPISPDIISPSRVTGAFQWLSDLPGPGKFITRHAREKLTKGLTNVFDSELVTRGVDLPSPKIDIKNVISSKNKMFNKMYGAAKKYGGRDAHISVDNISQYIKESSETFTGKGDQYWDGEATEFLKGMSENGTVTLQEVNDLANTVWNRYGKLQGRQKLMRGGLLDAIKADLNSFETDRGIRVTKKFEIGRKLSGMVKEFGKARYIEKLVDNATSFNPATEALEFNPLMFVKRVKNNKNTLKRMLRPEQFDRLNRFVDMAEATIPDKQRLAGQKTSFVDIAAMSAMAGATLKAPLLLIPAGFQATLAKSIMNPTGIMRKWLTTGFEPAIGKAAAATFARMPMLDFENDRE